jgi:replicative DNA helicase
MSSRPGFRHDQHDSRVEQLRVPPHSVEAEQAVLGGIMLAPESFSEVADLLQPADFYRRDHQLIYQAIIELEGKKQPFDAVTLGDWFEGQGMSELVVNGAYLVDLARYTPSAANARAYAQIVLDKALLRQVIEVGTDIVNLGFTPEGKEASEVCADAAGKAAQLTLRGARDGGLTMIRSGLAAVWDEMEARNAGTSDVGLQPPWKNVCKKLPGLEDTDFMVIAGRPSMGKTAAAMEWACYAADMGRNVAIFSLEMSRHQLQVRMMSRQAKVDHSKMREPGGLSDEDWQAMTYARRHLAGSPIAIDDGGSLTIDAIRARASRMHTKVEGGLGLIVIDYIQLITASGQRGESRDTEVSRISRGCKQMAKDLRCPVIGLSQLNRSLESRTDKRPVMADLRESGAIEQDADVIMFVYRDDYYTKDKCGAPGVAEFIIGKQRQGPTGTAYLRHHLSYSSFEDYHGRRPDYTPIKVVNAMPNDPFDDFAEREGT